MKKTAYLIDNTAQVMLKFKSIAELKRYARENGLKIKPSPMNGLMDTATFYTESYDYIPL